MSVRHPPTGPGRAPQGGRNRPGPLKLGSKGLVCPTQGHCRVPWDLVSPCMARPYDGLLDVLVGWIPDPPLERGLHAVRVSPRHGDVPERLTVPGTEKGVQQRFQNSCIRLERSVRQENKNGGTETLQHATSGSRGRESRPFLLAPFSQALPPQTHVWASPLPEVKGRGHGTAQVLWLSEVTGQGKGCRVALTGWPCNMLPSVPGRRPVH